MALIKDGVLAQDDWTRLADDEQIPSEGGVIVSLERWQAERDRLAGRNAPVGLFLNAGQAPAAIENDLDHFGVIALNFETFKDGRAYSYARTLRSRYGYEGELRAVGDLVRDQLHYMQRCGFNAFDGDERITPEALAEELKQYSAVYQPSADTSETVFSLRGRRRAAAAE